MIAFLALYICPCFAPFQPRHPHSHLSLLPSPSNHTLSCYSPIRHPSVSARQVTRCHAICLALPLADVGSNASRARRIKMTSADSPCRYKRRANLARVIDSLERRRQEGAESSISSQTDHAGGGILRGDRGSWEYMDPVSFHGSCDRRRNVRSLISSSAGPVEAECDQAYTTPLPDSSERTTDLAAQCQTELVLCRPPHRPTCPWRPHSDFARDGSSRASCCSTVRALRC